MAADSENTLLFFDTGFFWKLAGKETGDAFAAGMEEAAEADEGLRELLTPPWSPWRTPFLFMELIGLSHSQFEKPPPFEIDAPVNEDTVITAFNHYKGHYESCPELQAEAIRKKIDEREEWISEKTGHNWFNVIQELGGHEGTPDWVQHALAFDAVHKLDPPLETRAAFQSELVAYGFFSEVRWVRNMSKFRLVKRFWDRTWSLLPPESKEGLEKESRAMRIKNHADYSDVDLIHVATLGVETEEGEHHKVVCLTCDDPDELIMRLRVYRGVLAHVRELYSDHADEHGYPEDYDAHWNGVVLCFDPETGSLVRRIDVRADAPPLPILGSPMRSTNDQEIE